MSAKFTPGPWFVVPQGCFVADRKVEFDGDGARVGEAPNMCIECASEANAHLIAAAPEMYHELEDSVRLMCNNCNQCELDTSGKPMFKSQVCEDYTRKVAVLNKARGEA